MRFGCAALALCLAGPAAAESKEDVADAIDAVARRVDALEDDVQLARGASLAGRIRLGGGLEMHSSDGDYVLSVRPWIRPRLSAQLPESFDEVDDAGFRLVNARLLVTGDLAQRLHLRLLTEFTGGAAALDAFAVIQFGDGHEFTVGQMKVPFLRANIQRIPELAFPLLPGYVDPLRYTRDVGAMVEGDFGRLHYVAGVYNGAGQNRGNDNIDFMQVLRFELGVIGPRFKRRTGYPLGRASVSEDLRLNVALGGTHDLVRVPATLGGVELDQRDADGDGETDNLRVFAMSADALLRYSRLELFFEGMMRLENWGTILNHSENSEVAMLVNPTTSGKRTYLGFASHAFYTLVPGTLSAGTRVSYGEVSLLGMNGRQVFATPPRGDRRLDVDAAVNLFGAFELYVVRAMYRVSHYPHADEDDNATDHLFLLESLIRL